MVATVATTATTATRASLLRTALLDKDRRFANTDTTMVAAG
mgnify:CR=1 FL=1